MLHNRYETAVAQHSSGQRAGVILSTEPDPSGRKKNPFPYHPSSDGMICKEATSRASFFDTGLHQAIMSAAVPMDDTDRAILRLIARDASLSLAEIAAEVHLTPTPCWKRIRRLEKDGVIRARIAVLDQQALGLPVSVFVSVETADHSADWLERFAALVDQTPEIVDAWRMGGDVDYLLHVVVSDISSYDAFYRRLIAALPLRNVTSRFAMERIKSAPLPL
jgi:Lrp/AsnC family transcriptional regulator